MITKLRSIYYNRKSLGLVEEYMLDTILFESTMVCLGTWSFTLLLDGNPVTNDYINYHVSDDRISFFIETTDKAHE